MNYLSVEKISRRYGEKLLFEDISFGLDQGQKVALVGINGCGKSSLLKILAGVEGPDEGKLSMRKGIRLGYLPQEPALPESRTVAEVVFNADVPALKLLKEYEQLLQKGAAGSQQRLQQLTAEIDALQAWDYEVKVRQILSKLGVNFLDTPIARLSGGQRKRVALARLLIESPELLILDEPTNHLDIDSIEWLEKYLSASKQSLLMVTHDRYFLDSITNEIFELDGGKLYVYKGNYEYFLEKKAEREQLQDEAVDKARNLLRTELEWLRRSPKARTSKSRSRIDSVHALQKRAAQSRDTRELNFQVQGRRLGGKILELHQVSKSYGELPILRDFSYKFAKNERVGIVGPNGVGKTTFLRLLTGELPPDQGHIEKGSTVHIGHYRQEGLRFRPGQKIIEVIQEVAEGIQNSKGNFFDAGQLLTYFYFPHHLHQAPVSILSGGERRRLYLLRILMQNPNFLIMDEPTNDLDLMTLRRLEAFLMDFPACLVIVSHDRYFMDRLVDHIFVFEGQGRIKDFPGSYSQYQAWKASQSPP
ncbi:MAG: ABC transporter ATP-binding protein, partial [Bacteroidetes bacterium]